MKALTYINKGRFKLREKEMHGAVLMAEPGITVGLDIVGVVEDVGYDID